MSKWFFNYIFQIITFWLENIDRKNEKKNVI